MAEEIICVDCGGPCYRLSYVPEGGFKDGDVVAYRCRDCNDRWDIVLEVEVEVEMESDVTVEADHEPEER